MSYNTPMLITKENAMGELQCGNCNWVGYSHQMDSEGDVKYCPDCGLSEDGTQKKVKSVGTANGWSETPEVVVKCRELGHSTVGKTVGRCLTRYTCHKCGYTYKVDSGD